MLPYILTFSIVAAAALVFGFVEHSAGLAITWHLIAGVLGLTACFLFLIWTVQRLFPAP